MPKGSLFLHLCCFASWAAACDVETEATTGLVDNMVLSEEHEEEVETGVFEINELKNEPQVQEANSLDRLNSCEWAKESTSSDTYLYTECPSGLMPISGGCYNSSTAAYLTASHPFEDGSLNLPEATEKWYNLDTAGGAVGWRCEKSSTTGTLTAVALCCGTPPPP